MMAQQIIITINESANDRVICLDTALMASRGDVSIFHPDIHQLAAKLIMPPLNSCDAATAGCGFVQINLQILVVKLNINLGT